MQVLEQVHLHRPGRVLLHRDPQEGAQVVEQTHSPGSTALQEFKGHVREDQVPAKYGSCRTLDRRHAID